MLQGGENLTGLHYSRHTLLNFMHHGPCVQTLLAQCTGTSKSTHVFHSFMRLVALIRPVACSRYVLAVSVG